MQKDFLSFFLFLSLSVFVFFSLFLKFWIEEKEKMKIHPHLFYSLFCSKSIKSRLFQKIKEKQEIREEKNSVDERKKKIERKKEKEENWEKIFWPVGVRCK